jgi:hypothetical protein
MARLPNRCCRLACLLIAVTGTGACVGVHVRPLTEPEATIRRYAIFVDEQGRAQSVDVGRESHYMSDSAYRVYLGHLIASVRDSHRTDLLIRVHGGRTSLDGALDASLWARDSILRDTLTAFYPLFINWESRDASSYGEHVFYVRQGQRYGKWYQGPLLFPFYLLADLGGGLARLPIAAGYQVWQFWFPGTDAHVHRKEQALRASTQPNDSAGARPVTGVGRTDEITVDTGRYRPGRGEEALDFLKVTALLPAKLFTLYAIESAGRNDYANMHRRTSTMFRNPSEFSAYEVRADYVRPSGAVSIFLDALDSLLRTDTAGGKRYSITLIGHSMGGIVANEMVRSHPSLPYKNIVFMASASTAREFEVGVLPYLEAHKETQFYDLTLNRLAEVQEQEFFGIVPRGSLLSWLDGYLTGPETDMDRTIGRYDNVLLATHLFPDSVRGQVHVKAFGYKDPVYNYGTDLKPFRHGQFIDPEMPFWRCEYWVAPKTRCREGSLPMRKLPDERTNSPS